MLCLVFGLLMVPAAEGWGAGAAALLLAPEQTLGISFALLAACCEVFPAAPPDLCLACQSGPGSPAKPLVLIAGQALTSGRGR